MARYTYEEFEDAAKKSGLYGQFSQADLDTAKSNPEFGQSMLSIKQNWNNAANDEEKQKWHDQADTLRSSYGNYTGGNDGSQFISTGKLNNDIDNKLDEVNNYQKFQYDVEAPTYTNQFGDQQQALLEQMTNRDPFEWSKESDPLWSSYKKSYLREGDRATQNAVASAAAASGGMPSSYAVTAGTQAGDYYATKLNDVLPTLRANAYDEYLNEYQQLANNLSALNNQEQLEYQKYLNELNQYNTDRSFAYNDYQTQYNMLQNALSNLQGQQQNEYNQAYQTQQYIDALEQYREQQKQQEIENAMNAAQIFGYVPENFAGTLGIDAGTRTADQAYREYQMAQQAAKAVAGTGNSSSGSGKSGGSSGNESKMTLTTAKQAASNGAFNDQVLSVLRENGYTDDMLEAIYGYTPTTAAGAQEESGMNDAYFTAAMRSVSGALSSGNVSGAQSAIDQIWDRLSPAQQASVSKLIQSYGGTMQ